MNCVFCNIVKTDSNNQILNDYKYGDNRVVVFEPLDPCHPGHRLFVHSLHTHMLNDSVEDKERLIISDIMTSIGKYSEEQGIKDYNVIINRGIESDQTVFHLHVHFIPRKHKGEVEMPWSHQQR